jgi:hypothetical protein
MDEINGTGARQALFEDFDTKKEEIVLRFASRHSAVYPFEGDVCPQPQPTNNATPPAPRKPLSDLELKAAETKAKQIQAAIRIRRERQQSSNPLEGIL